MSNYRKLGLALSGGGARGLAHIGVIKYLYHKGIRFDFISGTSFGAIVGAAISAGMSIDQLEQEALRYSQIRELLKLIDPSPKRRGLLEGSRVRFYLGQLFSEIGTFEDLIIPLSVNAVDLRTGKEVIFTKGPLLPAIYASIAVPGIFTPVEYNGKLLVDGGVINNLPVDLVKEMGAEIVIAVDVHFHGHYGSEWDESLKPHTPLPIPDYFYHFMRAETIMVSELTHRRLAIYRPDILICPDIPSEITSYVGFTHAAEIIAAGEDAAQKALSNIFEVQKR